MGHFSLEEERNACRVLLGNPEGQKPLRKGRNRK
jgi:hypothetical protein